MKPAIIVKTQYTRSVNIERDYSAEAVIRSYIPTTRALSTLKRITDTFQDGSMPRAWALIGPYGSGKSSFAAFLSALLSTPKDSVAKIASTKLRESERSIASSFDKHIADSEGYCSVLITGSPEPLSARVVQALHLAAKACWDKRRSKPAVIKKLGDLALESSPSVSSVIQVTKDLLDALKKINFLGVVLMIDELGKFLEYEARHNDANDIYLLQALAELSNEGNGVKLHCFVLLHQSIEQYAQGLGEALRNEWYKVQGRFETVPFLESSEQVLRVVAAAIDGSRLSKDQVNEVRKFSLKVSKTLAKSNALPAGLDEERATELFTACYPLHPIAALILPNLCQKVAQNERTLFSYLGSQEPFGFKDSLARLEAGTWVSPSDVYDYFILNQPRLVSDPVAQRRWAEVVSAVERLGDASPGEVALLKLIGLLNIIGIHAGLKASKNVLALAFSKPAAAEGAAADLVAKSIVQFRKFSGEYRVWQGSDFDLESAIQSELSNLGRISLSEYLNERASLQPIVVRKHSIQTATLRYFKPIFVDSALWLKLKEKQAETENPRLILFLSESRDDQDFFTKEVCKNALDSDVVVLVSNGDQLRSIIAEVVCLEKIGHSYSVFNSDPVAAREFKDRSEAAVLAEREAVVALFDQPKMKQWYWKGEKQNISTKREMQERLSKVMDSLYCSAPIFRNEMVNCDVPSSAANGARNKLLMLLLNHSDTPDLGIDKFPPEKAVYRSIFHATGLHRKTESGWRLCPPEAGNAYNLDPLWKEISKLLHESEHRPLRLAELEERFTKRPFGIKKGLLPFIYLWILMVHKDELAIYDDGQYAPRITDELIERLTRRPDFFSIQQFKLAGIRTALLNQYLKALDSESKGVVTLLSVAQPLVQFVASLTDYARKTKSIPAAAQSIRAAIMYSKSPSALIFKELPAACGYPDFSRGTIDDSMVHAFADELSRNIRILQGVYMELLSQMQSSIATALGFEAGIKIHELRKALVNKYSGKEIYSVDTDGLVAFIRRLTSSEEKDDSWLERVLMFLGQKPASKWEDKDKVQAEFRLSAFVRRLHDLYKLTEHNSLSKGQAQSENISLRLVRVARIGGKEHEIVVPTDDKQEIKVNELAKTILQMLSNDSHKSLHIAALAEAISKIDNSASLEEEEKQSA